MKIPFQFMTKSRVREALLRSETEVRLRGPHPPAVHPVKLQHTSTATSMNEEDELRFRRIMAILHYGEETANTEYEALLAEGEKDYLDGYIVQQRWAQLWIGRNRSKYLHR